MRKTLKLEIIKQINESGFPHADELKKYLNDYPNKCKFIGKREEHGIKCKDYVKIIEILVKHFEPNEEKKEAYQDYLVLYDNIIKVPENILRTYMIECRIKGDYFTFAVFYIENLAIVGCTVSRLFEQDIFTKYYS